MHIAGKTPLLTSVLLLGSLLLPAAELASQAPQLATDQRQPLPRPGLQSTAWARPTGTIPHRSYPSAQVHRQISPDLSKGVHHNQSHVIDGRLFISGNGRQEIWDIQDPYQPARVAVMNSPHRAGEAEGHQLSFAVIPGATSRRICAVTVSGRGIDFWEISNPAAPVLLHALQLSGINYGENTQAVWGLSWQGRYVYVGGTNTGLHVVDALDPQNPQLVTRVPVSLLGGVSAGPVATIGNLLVLTTPKGSAGVATLDISDPDAPVLLDVLRPATGRSSHIGAFFGGHAFLQKPLRTYDVTSDPHNITLLGSTTTPSSEYMTFGNGRLYLGSLRTSAGGVGGVLEYDISNPKGLIQTAHIPARNNPDADDQFPLPIGNLLVLGDDQAAGEQGSFLAPLAATRDTIPPRVLYTNPGAGATQQSIHARIGISFDDQIELATLDTQSLILRPVGGQALSGRFGILHSVVSFWPDAPLKAHTSYEVLIPAGGITDLVGNPIAQPYSFSFRTGGIPAHSNSRIDPVQAVATNQPAGFRLTSPDATRFNYAWDLGDGSPTKTGAQVSHSYSQPGRYTVQVRTSDRRRCVYQAEHGLRAGGTVEATNNAGYRGLSFIDYPSSGGSLTLHVQAGQAGKHDLLLRFALGANAARKLTLRVNQGAPQTLTFAPTGSWTDWDVMDLPGIPLQAGDNSLELRADAGTPGPNIDDLSVFAADDTEHEASWLHLAGGVAAGGSNPGYEGAGYAAFPGSTGRGVGIGWGYVAVRGGDHEVLVRYGSPNAQASALNLYVDGQRAGTLTFPAPGGTGKWRSARLGQITLSPGTHHFELVADAGSAGPQIDQIRLVPPPIPAPRTNAVTQIVHRPLTSRTPTHSTAILVDSGQRRAWVAHSDGNTVGIIDTDTQQIVRNVEVGAQPIAIAAQWPRGEVWVASRRSHDIHILRHSDGQQLAVIPLPYASQPEGLLFDPDGSQAYVSLGATGQVLRIDAATRQVNGTLTLGGGLRGMAMSADGQTLLIAPLISPTGGARVFAVDTASFSLRQQIPLALDPGPDTPDSGRGIPNYLRALVISPDGQKAWLAAKKDNIARGGYRDGKTLGHDNTVRPILCQLDMGSGSEDLPWRADLNDADAPAALCTSPHGDLIFVALQGLNQIDVRNAYTGDTVASLSTGLAPQALELDNRGRLYVLDFLGRSVTVIDVASILDATDSSGQTLATIQSTAPDPVAPGILRGKRIFYNAADPRMAFEGYLSCASCHLDGGEDGRVWDFTDRGEGLRNTISLLGVRGMAQGRVHWTGNFDEIQDFENDIRGGFGGKGFLSDAQFHAGTRSDPLGDKKAGLNPDLDALADFVRSLELVPPSPHRRQDGQLTAAGRRGRSLFDARGCASCHAGPTGTDSVLGRAWDVGTISPQSGQGRGQALTGIDTPTLRGIWATAPYHHDGSAPTLHDVLRNGKHGGLLSPSELDDLVAYMQQIDETIDLRRHEHLRISAAGVHSLHDGARAIDAAGGMSAVLLPRGTAGRIQFRVGVEDAGRALLRLRAHNPGAALTLQLKLNGRITRSLELPGGGTSDTHSKRVPLRAGRNELELLFPPSASDVTVFELEVSGRR